jgi:hypothetical protein
MFGSVPVAVLYFAEMAVVCLVAYLPVQLGMEVQKRWGKNRGIAAMFAGWIILFSLLASTAVWFWNVQCRADPTLRQCQEKSWFG